LGEVARDALLRKSSAWRPVRAHRLRRYRQACKPIRLSFPFGGDTGRVPKTSDEFWSVALPMGMSERAPVGSAHSLPGHRAPPAAGLRTRRWWRTGSATLGSLAFTLCRWLATPAATSATRSGDSRTFALTHTWKRTLLSRCLCTREQGHGRTASGKFTSSAPGRAAKTVKSGGLEPRGHDGSAQPIRR
jgi:hypothetical protein